jgi:hypothetical protein
VPRCLFIIVRELHNQRFRVLEQLHDKAAPSPDCQEQVPAAQQQVAQRFVTCDFKDC